MAKNKKSGLGRGLDSLIPTNVYDENFDFNSSLSLEDMLNDKANDDKEDNSEKSVENIQNNDSDVNSKVDEDNISEIDDLKIDEDSGEGINDNYSKVDADNIYEIDDLKIDNLEDDDNEVDSDSITITPQIEEHIKEVEEIVKKNPRITLWSVQSASVFRYLRKTKPEFSISKEASSLIDEAVSKKYPEIWKLFDN